MNANKASLMLNKELGRLQKQMKAEIDKVVKEHQEQVMPNARVLISLAFYADTFVKHLEEREQTEATEALIKEYKTFRMALNLHEA